MLRFDPGFDAAHTLQFDLTTTDPKIYPVTLREKVYRELESHPGVAAVSWAWYMPFNFSYGEYQLRRADKTDATGFKITAQGIGPGYLKTMGIPLLAGRELDWNDVALYGKAAARPALINQAFARKYFPERNPVGERLIAGLNRSDSEQMLGGFLAAASVRWIRWPSRRCSRVCSSRRPLLSISRLDAQRGLIRW